jgi:hypothetical protein
MAGLIARWNPFHLTQAQLHFRPTSVFLLPVPGNLPRMSALMVSTGFVPPAKEINIVVLQTCVNTRAMGNNDRIPNVGNADYILLGHCLDLRSMFSSREGTETTCECCKVTVDNITLTLSTFKHSYFLQWRKSEKTYL